MTLIYFIFVLLLCIIIHELGHLLVAKLFNVYCHEFSIGMGKKLFEKKYKETNYTIRMLPIGGFVAMAGDTENALETSVNVEVPYHRTLNGIARWKKILIMLAGVVMNFILSIIIVAIILLNQGAYAKPSPAVVDGVMENSVASEVGLLKGDIIKKLELSDGRIIKPETFDDILMFTSTNKDELIYTVLREGKELEFRLTPVLDETDGIYKVGVFMPKPEVVEVNVGNSIIYSVDYLWTTTKAIVTSLSHLITGKGLEQVSGPVGMYESAGTVVSMGIDTMVLFIALISLNLGVFNLLPIPVLDGGRILITLIEMIFNKPINKKIENAIMTISVLLLLGLMIVVTFKDVITIFWK